MGGFLFGFAPNIMKHYPENCKYLYSEFKRVWNNKEFKKSVEKVRLALQTTKQELIYLKEQST